MKIAIITGSGGLIGSEAVEFFINQGFKVIGIDNNMRQYFFGKEASVKWNINILKKKENYIHKNIDIRHYSKLKSIFSKYNKDIKIVIHTASQPSHDWACKEPITDFTINANGTLNLLELTRLYCPKTCFVFTSTNKVYGDNPNKINLKELETRFEPEEHRFYNGFNERLSIDNCVHSLFGASKSSADLLVQEYGKYFKINTVCFRGGCLTGGNHSGTKLHGFLSYLMRCCLTKTPYTIFGYKGKQVRDNIHSFDFLTAIYEFYQNPKQGEVYNMGGGRNNSCSILEAIKICEKITGNKFKYKILKTPRIGDHQWYITDYSKFQHDYPNWKQKYTLEKTLKEIYSNLRDRL